MGDPLDTPPPRGLADAGLTDAIRGQGPRPGRAWEKPAAREAARVRATGKGPPPRPQGPRSPGRRRHRSLPRPPARPFSPGRPRTPRGVRGGRGSGFPQRRGRDGLRSEAAWSPKAVH